MLRVNIIELGNGYVIAEDRSDFHSAIAKGWVAHSPADLAEVIEGLANAALGEGDAPA